MCEYVQQVWYKKHGKFHNKCSSTCFIIYNDNTKNSKNVLNFNYFPIHKQLSKLCIGHFSTELFHTEKELAM